MYGTYNDTKKCVISCYSVLKLHLYAVEHWDNLFFGLALSTNSIGHNKNSNAYFGVFIGDSICQSTEQRSVSWTANAPIAL